MMDLWERMTWLVFGGMIGFVAGYIVRSLHDIKDKVERVDEIIESKEFGSKWEGNENGFMRHPIVADIFVIVVVIISAWASFATAKVNSELRETNEKLRTTIECITNYNVKQAKALKTRDHSVKSGVSSEIDLWQQYGRLYAQAKRDPEKIPALQEKLNQAIGAHRESLGNLQETREDTPYPNPDVLENCKEE